MQKCVLYVEDDEDSVFFFKLAFKKTAIVQPLVTLEDGDLAIKYLHGTELFANRDRHPLPCLLLLDIKLPKKSGFEVLELVRKTPAIESLPVVMLTSSPLPADIVTARELGADHYLVKPPELERLTEMIKMVHDRWISPQPNVIV